MEKIYGVLMRSIRTGEEREHWFHTEEERNKFILYRCSFEYDIVEFLGDQMTLNLDTR